MTSLSLPSSTISTIIDNPSLLNSVTSPSSPLASLGLSSSTASFILSHGYNRGFRSVFLLHASLASIAVVVSIFMIRHKELIRGDDEALKAEAKRAGETEKKHKGKSTGPGDEPSQALEDLEMGKVDASKN
jgi:hypothetical protein